MRTTCLVLLVLGACGTDPVGYSQPVGIDLDAKSADTANATVTESKDITTENGNPYGAFVNDAIMKLGGVEPSQLGVDRLTLTLGGDSTGVAGLEEVVTGDVDVALIVNSSGATYDAGHVTSPTGVGPVDLDPVFDWTQIAAADRSALLGGSFKVVLRAPAAATFSTKGADARLQVTFTFSAFK